MATPYQLPSSFLGGIQGASNALSAGKLPQSVQSPILKQILPTPKPAPVDPNKSPEVFKKRFIEKHGDGVAEDGRNYSQIPAPEIVAKVIRKYGDGNTTDGIPYREFLPRPASPNDSLEYRLSQIESLSQAPKSQFYAPTGTIRGQTEQEKKFTTAVTKRENEGELVKTLKAPYRAVYNAMETPSQGLQMAVSDALNLVGADGTSKNLTKQLVKDKFEQDTLNKDNKGLIGGIQAGSPSSIIGALVTAIPNLMLYANPAGATAGIISTGGGLSLEGEAQGQTGVGDKAIAYSAGTISGLIDKISGQKFIDGLLSKGIKKEVAQGFVTKTKNFLKTLKPSDFEAGTEVIQQKIENWGRQLMGTEYDKGWKQYAEAGLMGKILGKVADVGQSQAPVTTLPPAPPKPSKTTNSNIETLQTIKIGKRANTAVERNKGRGFDPYLDIATHQEIVPTVDKTGLVRTTEQVQNLEDTLDPINDALTQSIKDEGVKIRLDKFLANSLKEAKQYENEGASYERYINQIRKDFEVYKRFTDAEGRIDLSKINEIKKAKYGISNFSDVESDKANKMVGRAAKELVEKYTKGESTKAINRELSRWYSARDLLLAMDGKTVKGGRLGKMAARVGGNIIGSYFGPLGSFAGGEISAAVQGQMMKGSIKTPKGNIDSGSILSKIPKRTTPQLPPASQSSVDKKVELPKQSQPVSVLGLPSQTPVVVPKKEVSGKKVNAPIIQKLAKKQETPKLPVKTNEITPGKAEALKYENMKTEDLQNILIEENKRLIKEGHYANESKGDIEDMLYRKINSYGMWSPRDKIQPKFTSDLIDDTVSNLEQKGKEVYGAKSPVETPKTPQEGKTLDKIKAMQLEQENMIRKGESISDDFRIKWNDLQPQYKKEFIDSRIASEKKKVDSAISEIQAKAKSNPDRADWAKNQIEMEEKGFNALKKGDYFEKKYQEHIKTIREEAKKSSLLKSIKDKPKPSLPKTPQEGKIILEEAKKYNTSEKFVIKNKQSDYDNSTFLEPYIGKEIEFTIGNGQRVKGIIYKNTNGDIVGVPTEKFTLRHNGKTIESNFDDFEVPLNSNFKLNGHSVRMKDGGFLGDEISKDIYKQANKKASLPLSQKSEVKYSKPDLASEAKKYKSAEEFVKAQGEPVYHGTPNIFEDFDINKVGDSTDPGMWGKGFYFTPDYKIANTYKTRGGKTGRVMEVYLSTKNPLVISSKSDIPKITIPEPKSIKEMAEGSKIYSEKFREYLKDNGYDSVIDNSASYPQVVVFEPSQIKTKQQLLDIYNKANKNKDKVIYSDPNPKK